MHGVFQISPKEGAEIHYDLSFDRYKALGGVNHHLLETFRRSPKKADWESRHHAEPTPAMVEGEFIHAFVLEHERCRKEWGVLPSHVDLRTKEGKALKADFIARYGERRVVSEEMWYRALAMRQSILQHQEASMIAEESANRRTEITCQWWDSRATLLRKMRIDCGYFEGEHECQPLDLKTVQDASFDGFRRAMFKYGWHRQAAYYLEGLHACGIHASEFRFVAVEKTAPYCVGVYAVGPITIERAARENLEALKFYRRCATEDRWPNWYGPEDGHVETVELYEEELYAE